MVDCRLGSETNRAPLRFDSFLARAARLESAHRSLVPPEVQTVKNTFLLAAALCLSASTSSLFAADEPAAPKPGSQTAETLDVKVPVRLQYLLYVPKDYDKSKPTPLMLFLHGAGERGTDVNKVKIHGPPKLIAAGKEFPCIVVSPQCPADRWWQPLELLALLDELGTKYNVDPERVYVTGLSMGGFGTWELATIAPRRFAALAPICGGAEAFWAKQIAHIPTWVFHGDKDAAVPLVRSEIMVAALMKAGAEPKFTVYEGVGHDSWTATYDDPKFYEWLFAQTRQEPKPNPKK